MGKTILTATSVRNDFFRLIDQVEENKQPIFIKKGNKVRVKLTAVGTELAEDWEETNKMLDRLYGMWANSSKEEITGRFRKADLTATGKMRRPGK